MLYDAYENRIQKIARVLNFIRRHALILLSALALIVTAIAALLATKGIAGKAICPEQIYYGDSLPVEGYAFLSSVSFEFRSEDGEWSDVQPHTPGTYFVRGVGKSITGKTRYGAESTFTILPRTLDVRVSDSTVVYGEMPHIHATLPFGDTLQCDEVLFHDILQVTTNVEPNAASIRILSSDGLDVTDYYELNTLVTSISITPRTLDVTVETATHTYDNQKFSYDKYEISGGSLAENDTLQATFEKWLIDAGTLANEPTLRVFNKNGQDVTHHYRINGKIGNLVVEKRPLVIVTGTAAPVLYDASEHSHRSFALCADTPLITGHRLEIVTATDVINAGTYENVLTFRVVDEDGNDRSDNYSLLVSFGTLEIKKRAVSVSTPSESWIYDGQTHVLALASVSGLLSDHTYDIENAPSITDAGSAINALTIRIRHGDDDVTDNYAPQYTYGELRIIKRPITLKPDDASFVYDAAPHTGEMPVVAESSPNPLVDGHELSATVTGSRTEIGSAHTRLLSYRISDGTRDVTTNYEVAVQEGRVTITPRPIRIVITNAGKIYDGIPLHSAAFTVEAVSPLTFALAQGHQISTVMTGGAQTDVGSSENAFLSCRILDGERDVTHNYAPQGIAGILKVDPRPITVSSGSATKPYDGTPLVCHDTITVIDGSLAPGQHLDMSATGEITDPGKIPNTIEGTVRNAQNRDVGTNYLITLEPGTLEILPPPVILVTTGSAEAAYTGDPLTCEMISYQLLSGVLLEGHQILLTSTGSQTEIGKSLNTFDISITDAQGKDAKRFYKIEEELGMLVVYDPSPDDDGDLPDKPVIKITATYQSKVFDGTPLYAENEIEVCPILTELLLQNYTYRVRVSGSQTAVGRGVSEIIEFVLYDPTGKDVTDDYDIIRNPGELEVFDRSTKLISVYLYQRQKYYDGTPLTYESEDFEVLDLEDGLQLDLTLHISLTEVGQLTLNDINSNFAQHAEYRVLCDGTDVSDLYRVVFVLPQGMPDTYIPIRVQQRPLELTTKSAEKLFDGTALTSPGYSISMGSLLSGHHIAAFFVQGEQLQVGESICEVDPQSVIILDSEGNDVTQNYSITSKPGTLTVLPESSDT